MKIGIDARFVGPEGTGIGKYTEKLIENLQKIDTKNQYAIFLKESNWNYLKNLSKNFRKVLADVSWYSLEEQIRMPTIYSREKFDLLHVPHFNVPILYRGKFIVTIHDLIHQQFSETSATTRNALTFRIKKLGYKKIIKHAVSKSQGIITPSKFVKDQVVTTFTINPAKITVTYEAAEQEYFQNGKPETKSQKPILLYVGNAYPHKNLEKLLDAFEIVLKFTFRQKTRSKRAIKNLKLILVCPRDVFWQKLNDQIKTRNLKSKVALFGYLDPKELTKLFKKASAYISPSLSEGFGIPGLNAMASNIPLICSDIPTFSEIYGDASLYFDPVSAKDIAEKIKKLLTNTKTRSDLVKNGREQVKKYSWQKMAQQTLQIYESCV